MKTTSLKHKTAKGLFWGGISNGGQQLLVAFFGIILARILDESDYGMVGMLAIFSGIGGIIQESGFTAALINQKTIRHEYFNSVFWFNVIISIVIYILLFLAAPIIANFYNKPELVSLSRLLFLSFLFGGLGMVHNAVLYKNLMVKERAIIDISALALSSITGILLALNGFAFWGLAIQSVTYVALSSSLRWYFSPWRPTLSFSFQPVKEMFGFSSKILFTNILFQISNNIFSVLLGKFYDEREVGYYSQGNKWSVMGHTTISGMINSVAQPVLVEVLDDKDRVQHIFHKMLRFGAFISFPALFGLAFISEEFITIAIGEKWLPSVPYLQLFCLWGAFAYISGLYTNLLIAHGKSNIYMQGVACVCILQLAAVALLFQYGIISMIIGYLLCNIVGLLFWHYNANRLIKLDLWSVIKDIFPYLSITFMAFAITWVSTRWIDHIYLRFIAKIVIAAGIYSGVIWLSGSTIMRESIEYLLKKRRS